MLRGSIALATDAIDLSRPLTVAKSRISAARATRSHLPGHEQPLSQVQTAGLSGRTSARDRSEPMRMLRNQIPLCRCYTRAVCSPATASP